VNRTHKNQSFCVSCAFLWPSLIPNSVPLCDLCGEENSCESAGCHVLTAKRGEHVIAVGSVGMLTRLRRESMAPVRAFCSQQDRRDACGPGKLVTSADAIGSYVRQGAQKNAVTIQRGMKGDGACGNSTDRNGPRTVRLPSVQFYQGACRKRGWAIVGERSGRRTSG